MSYELFYAYGHAAEARLSQTLDARFSDAVEAVRIGFIIAQDKKALREWRRRRTKSSKAPVGLTGKALDRAMNALLVTHPEFQKGVKRPRHLQPRALWAAEAAAKRKTAKV